jgi:hypothetical protein
MRRQKNSQKLCVLDAIIFKDFLNGDHEDVAYAIEEALKSYVELAAHEKKQIVGGPYAIPQPVLFDKKKLDVIVRALIKPAHAKRTAVRDSRTDGRVRKSRKAPKGSLPLYKHRGTEPV